MCRSALKPIAFLLGVAVLAPSALARPARKPQFAPMGPEWREALTEIRGRLAAEGLSDEAVSPLQVAELLYVDKAVELKMLSKFEPQRGASAYYNQRSVWRAAAFMREHRATLALAEEEYGVSPSIIAAILWIETHYGDFKPIYPTLSTAASLAALSVPRIGQAEAARVQALARDRGSPVWNEVDWAERAQTIGDRWYLELKFLLELKQKMEWRDDALQNMKGSWAAAIGYGQFLPSTALRNLDCGGTLWRANLWAWPDTIQLVARHVSENGWSRDADAHARRESILRYNRLESYADAVLLMSTRLDGTP